MAQKSQGDLEEHFREQTEFLRSSAKLFDDGMPIEAIRLATVFRTLLHDGPASSRSLLSQLGVKQELRYLSTGSIPAGTNISGAWLAPIRMSPDPATPPSHVALLHDAPIEGRQVFGGWWNADVIQAEEVLFTRKDVVHTLANKEGGAHVDPKRQAKYDLLRTYGLGFSATNVTGDSIDLGNPALATMRQMTFELEVTIHECERLAALLAV